MAYAADHDAHVPQGDAELSTCDYCGHLYDVDADVPGDGTCSVSCSIILAWERQGNQPGIDVPTAGF